MFENVAKKPKKKARKATQSLENTVVFLTAIVDNGARLSYGAFAGAAKALDKDMCKQIPAQRGSSLVKTLPTNLQPYICQKSGGYAKGIKWDVETPDDLTDRPVIDGDGLGAAIKEWKASLKTKKADEETSSS